MQSLFNTLFFISISVIGVYLYLTNPIVSNNLIPVTHIECVEEEPFIFGDSFKPVF
jgi:hypothetical protein